MHDWQSPDPYQIMGVSSASEEDERQGELLRLQHLFESLTDFFGRSKQVGAPQTLVRAEGMSPSCAVFKREAIPMFEYSSVKYPLNDPKDEEIKRLRHLLSGLPGIIYRKDSKGRYVDYNTVQAALFSEYTHQVMLGKTDSELFTDVQSHEWVRNDLDASLSTDVKMYMERYFDKDSVLRHVVSLKKAWVGMDGKRDGLIGCSFEFNKENLMDNIIQERDQAEKDLRTRDEFIQSFTHDARTPLSGMIGLLDLLGKEPLESDQSRALLECLRASLDEYLSFFNTILDNQKDNYITCSAPSWFSPWEECKSMERLYGPSLAEKALTINIISNAGEENISCLGHEALFKKLMCNLVSNSIKFTQKGSITISISVDESKEYLLIFVEDTGIGMSQYTINNLYKKFSKAKDNHAKGTSGVGLGLYMVKKYMEFTRGKIDVQSMIGRGTTFFLQIPMVMMKADQKTKKSEKEIFYDANHHGSLQFPGPILLVEDTELPAIAIKQLLKNFDASVRIDHAVDIRSAQKYLSEYEYVLVFMDIGLPDGNGVDLIEYAKKSQNNTNTPIVAVSGYGDETSRMLSLKKGAKHFFLKPLLPSQLVSIYRDIFEPA